MAKLADNKRCTLTSTLLFAYLLIDCASAVPTFGDEFVHIKVHVPGEETTHHHHHHHKHMPPAQKVIHHYHERPKPHKRKHHSSNDALLESILLAELDKPKFETDYESHESHHSKPNKTIVLEEDYYDKPKEEYKTYKVIHDVEHHKYKKQKPKYSRPIEHTPSYSAHDYLETIKVTDNELHGYQTESSAETDDHFEPLVPYNKYSQYGTLEETTPNIDGIKYLAEDEYDHESVLKKPYEYMYKKKHQQAPIGGDLQLNDYSDVFEHTNTFGKGNKHYFKPTHTPEYAQEEFSPIYSATDPNNHDSVGYTYPQYHSKNSLQPSGYQKENTSYRKVPFTLPNDSQHGHRPSSYLTKSVIVTSSGHAYPTATTEYYNTAGRDVPVHEQDEDDVRGTYAGADSYNAAHVQGLGSGVYKYTPPFL